MIKLHSPSNYPIAHTKLQNLAPSNGIKLAKRLTLP